LGGPPKEVAMPVFREGSVGASAKVLVLAAVVVLAVLGGAGCKTAEQSYFDELRDQGICFLSSVTPMKASVGTLVTITGELFGEVKGQVLFYGAADGSGIAAAVESWADTVITCRVPNAAVLDRTISMEVVRSDGVKTPNPSEFVILTNAAE
jgi:hypothetical protein